MARFRTRRAILAGWLGWLLLAGVMVVALLPAGPSQNVVRAGGAAVELVPDNNGAGQPGDTVIYVHTITNLGDSTDTFTMTVGSSRGWQVAVSPPQVTLGANQDETILVTVVVHPSAQVGDTDITTVTATSGNVPSVSDSAVDATVVPSPVFLPFISHNVGVDPPPPNCQLNPPPPANPAGVDLVVTNLTVAPNPPPAGQPAMVQVTLKNQGTASVLPGNNFLLDFYVDPNPEPPQPQQPGVLYWGIQGSDLPAGASRTYSAQYVFVAGSHHLYARADTDNNVVEAIENNNVYGCLGVTTEIGD
ncbi:MAG: hypothetical protein L0332_00685 [Chloroflexi bacterium]|nr:hypothetical protein [Chloroflexota bacterium]MCI0577601.1 hypothetical protein [Chloroflexota bacterium]MCI0644179.1 hypothetical protein [Chloroflexota bacterium]MCI0725238.1 hypothetical protein [Chloroflexota bacterium]